MTYEGNNVHVRRRLRVCGAREEWTRSESKEHLRASDTSRSVGCGRGRCADTGSRRLGTIICVRGVATIPTLGGFGGMARRGRLGMVIGASRG